MATAVYPKEIPLVVKADPTSRMASLNETPIDVKISENTTRTPAKKNDYDWCLETF